MNTVENELALMEFGKPYSELNEDEQHWVDYEMQWM